MKTAIYKAKIEIQDDGKVKITSYENRKIPFGLLLDLNEAVHEVRKKYNGDIALKRTFIRFEHEGVVYEQVESEQVCKGCVFNKEKDGVGCQHPYYLKGAKGRCEGKIYKRKGKVK